MAEQALRAGGIEQALAVRKRLVVRGRGGAGAPGWWALLPALGLAGLTAFATGPFARDWVEGAVREQVRQRLNQAGMSWVNVTVSGQGVLLAGLQPEAGAGDKALELARQTACPTWLGPLRCPVLVTGLFTGPAPAMPALPSAASGAGLSLPGLPALPTAGNPTGAATAAATRPAAPQAAKPAASSSAAQSCEQRFATLLADRPVRFGNASARIAAGNETLLDDLARVQRDCPMALTIEGHTDNVGSAESNQALSQARAEAVRQALMARGSAPQRLVAKGFGLERPIADNSTPEGRARNRRIEFRAVASGTPSAQNN